MDCELVRSLMSSYIDRDINEIDKNELEEHLKTCQECATEYRLLLSTVQYCNSIEELELPTDFHDEFHEKLKALNDKKHSKKYDKKYFRINWKWAAGIAAVFIVAVIGISQLPNLTQKDMAASEEAEYGYSQGAEPADAGGAYERGNVNFAMDSTQPNVDTVNDGDMKKLSITFNEAIKTKEKSEGEPQSYDRKIIVSGSISLEVTDFDDKMKSIMDLAQRYEGYVENSNVDNNSSYYVEGKRQNAKTGNISIRVPSDKFQIVLGEIKSMGEVKNENTNSVDISDAYYDTATRIENLKVQENRLRELLALAKNVDEILKIENELNRVRSEIDLMSTDIKRWDKQVSMSSLYIGLREVKDSQLAGVDVTTTWGRAYKGFIKAINNVVRGIESLFIFMVTALPYIAILAIVLIIVYYAVRRIRSKGVK